MLGGSELGNLPVHGKALYVTLQPSTIKIDQRVSSHRAEKPASTQLSHKKSCCFVPLQVGMEDEWHVLTMYPEQTAGGQALPDVPIWHPKLIPNCSFCCLAVACRVADVYTWNAWSC